MVDALYIIVAMVGMIVGLAGFLMNRDKKLSGDAEWRGSINAKLDTIHSDLGDVSTNVKCVQETLVSHGERITAVEKSTAYAHDRLNTIENKINI